jgi:hypothetical protein
MFSSVFAPFLVGLPLVVVNFDFDSNEKSDQNGMI